MAERLKLLLPDPRILGSRPLSEIFFFVFLWFLDFRIVKYSNHYLTICQTFYLSRFRSRKSFFAFDFEIAYNIF